MHNNLKKVMIAIAFIGMGTAVLTTTGQAKTTWHKGIPSAIKGTWIAPNGKRQKVDDLGFVYAYGINKSDIGLLFTKSDKNQASSGGSKYSYHHKKGSKYYYIKSPSYYTAYGNLVEYTRFKVSGKKLSVNKYGEVRSEINGNGKKIQPYGKYKKIAGQVTTWYKK